ncbi:TonB family protein [Calothrix sp. PCC 7507]|uniref:TonB family protein n=1 Tax=Calothrix sp. PCC 7507 TaxID=99598 RepID=UPI00029EEEA7|nr:TonB family protein [Calothrix sp. PCC 7507]AFY31693.1 TonB family protein [Calothrix sp. PCC 7507]
MSFTDIAVAQRSKEAVALRSFLVYSFMGSLAVHAGVLTSGIGNLLSRVPDLDAEPIEVAIVETPQAEVTKAPEAEIKPENPKIPEKNTFIPEPPKQKIEEIQAQVKNVPVQKIVREEQNREPIRQNTPKIAAASANQVSKPSSPDEIKDRTAAGGGGGGGGGGSSVLTGSGGSGVASSTGSGTGIGSGSGSGIGSGSGSGVGSGTGSGVGSGTGSGVGSGTGSGVGSGSPVATAPRTPAIEAPPAPVNRNGGNGRAACRECNAKYPEAARRRGVEGRVEVAVDTDSDGNVTNVRIARSSGNRELDEETARQARDWKLKPATGGRQGVSIATEFAIQGSRRHSEAQKRRQQREVEERNQQAAANNNSSTEETPRRRRLEASSNTDNSGESTREPQTRRRRSLTPASETESRISRRLLPEKAETTSESRASNNRGSLREFLRRTRRESAVSDSSSGTQPTKNRRRRRTEQARPASQSSLVESLRRSRQESPAAAPEAPATGN